MPLLASMVIDWNPWGPPWFVATALVAVVAFVAWLYRVDGRRLSRPRRNLLLVWRCLMVICILLLLMKPTYKLTINEKRSPVVTMLVDESASMSLPEARDNPLITSYADKDRAKRSRYTAAKNAAMILIPELAKTHRVRLGVASDRVRDLTEFPCGEVVKPEDVAKAFDANPEPSGEYSNLGEAIEDALRGSDKLKLSAMFLLTDGRLTSGASLEHAASEASLRKVPVNTIGCGTVEPLPDLRLTDLVAPPEANVNDPMPIQVTIVNTLRPSLRVDLKLFENDSKEPLTTMDLTLPLGERRVSLVILPKKEGEMKYTLDLPVFPDEMDPNNNRLSFHVNVVKRRLKLLFIAGAPTMEFHHIVPTLIRDPVMDVSCFLQSADVNAQQQGNNVIEELPVKPEEWHPYDVVVLYDIDPNKFSTDMETSLEQLVANGSGLMFISGRVHGMASMLQVRGAKMRAMLPVEINRNLYPDYDENFNQPFHIARTPQGQRHPVLMFSADKNKNDDVWRSFTDLDFFWNHPIIGVKHEAVPLLVKANKEGRSDDKDCVMALMRYNKGSSIFLGIHDLWRWRFPMENFDYSQFWSQTVRYLAEYRMLGAQRQVLLSTDKKTYAPGEMVKIQLAVLDPALISQLRGEQVFVTITDAQKGEYRVMLAVSPKDDSIMTGRFAARRQGEHEVRVRHVLSQDLAAQKALFDEKTHFDVRMQSLEFKDTTADLAALASLAARTGGTALDHKNVGEGLRKLPANVDTSPQLVRHESYADLWDRWWILALLLILGAGELWFRRYWGLL